MSRHSVRLELTQDEFKQIIEAVIIAKENYRVIADLGNEKASLKAYEFRELYQKISSNGCLMKETDSEV